MKTSHKNTLVAIFIAVIFAPGFYFGVMPTPVAADTHVVVVSGYNADGSFEEAVIESLKDTEVDDDKITSIPTDSNDATEITDRVEAEVDRIKAENPEADILVMSHSLGAIATFNADLEDDVTTYYYDPPYDADQFLGFRAPEFITGWNVEEIREARNNGIQFHPNTINWTDGRATGDDHMRFLVDSSDIKEKIKAYLSVVSTNGSYVQPDEADSGGVPTTPEEGYPGYDYETSEFWDYDGPEESSEVMFPYWENFTDFIRDAQDANREVNGPGLPGPVGTALNAVGTVLSYPIATIAYPIVQLNNFIQSLRNPSGDSGDGGPNDSLGTGASFENDTDTGYDYSTPGNPYGGGSGETPTTPEEGYPGYDFESNTFPGNSEDAPPSGYDWIDPATGRPYENTSGSGDGGPNDALGTGASFENDTDTGYPGTTAGSGYTDIGVGYLQQVGNYTYVGWDPRERQHVWQHNSAYPIQQSYGPAPPGGFPSSDDGSGSDGSDTPDNDENADAGDGIGVTTGPEDDPNDEGWDLGGDNSTDPVDPYDYSDIPDPSGDGSFSDNGDDTSTSDDSSGAFGCFLADTQILMSNGSTKPIEKIEVGEYVYTYDEYTDAYVSRMVTHVYEHEYAGEYLIINDTLNVTPNHITYINRAWNRIDTALVGGVLLGEDYEMVPIDSIRVQYTTENVYNLEIDEVHTYMAEGYLVHNIK